MLLVGNGLNVKQALLAALFCYPDLLLDNQQNQPEDLCSVLFDQHMWIKIAKQTNCYASQLMKARDFVI